MKKTTKSTMQAVLTAEVRGMSRPTEVNRAEQARAIKASIVKELHYRESKMRFRVI